MARLLKSPRSPPAVAAVALARVTAARAASAVAVDPVVAVGLCAAAVLVRLLGRVLSATVPVTADVLLTFYLLATPLGLAALHLAARSSILLLAPPTAVLGSMAALAAPWP